MSYTEADLPESKVEALLDELGFLRPYPVDVGSQLDPIVQLLYYNGESPAAGDLRRIISIICSGQNNPQDSDKYDDFNCTIIYAGKRDREDIKITKMLINKMAIELETLKFDKSRIGPGKIFSVVNYGVVGPMLLDGGRPVFELNLRLLISK